MEYFVHMGIILAIYAILIVSAQLIIGHARLISLSQGAFFGAGAYFTALSLIRLNLPFVPSVMIAIAGNALIGLLLAWPSARLKGDFFVLTTLGFQFIVFQLTYNLVGITGGPSGLGGIPSLDVPGKGSVSEPYFILLVSALTAVMVFYFYHRLLRSAFGRNIRAMSGHEILYKTTGRSVIRLKSQLIALSAATTALASGLFAVYMNYLDPHAFNLDKSILILTGVMLGGLTRLRGALLGAVVITLLPELLRMAGLPAAQGAALRQILFGIVLIAMMFYAAYRRRKQQTAEAE
jgi:branched-chain amino acid transport system permease protein